ncbi:MAG TPA: P-type conjugative transfer protein VirB9 [Rhizomicrobium sp.]|nr:P-type conjugative transfer protein VirB9 [Rhizomicrobium sp.]
MRLRLSILALVLALSATAEAAEQPLPGAADPRIRIVRYDPNNVIELTGTLGYAMSIEFGENEKIENVAIGDSQGWQVTPNRRANLLFVKPMRRDAVTNMAVFTNLRRYMFDLSVGPEQSARDRSIIFGVRFEYPEPAAAVVAADQAAPKPELPSDVNHAYSYEGSSKNLPTRVFDDGHSTYFAFSESSEYPAIFVVDGDNQESVVNVASRDGYLVVDRVARAFVLRRGQETTRIFNDGYHEEGAGPLSPRPRPEPTFFERLFQ